MIKQKHFMDIENLREEDTDLREGNGHGFQKGDMIQISEKFDGANACIGYDPDEDRLIAFSRKQQLSLVNTLNGFYEYVSLLSADILRSNPGYRVFGEWSGARNKIVYKDDAKNKWYVYDIFDTHLGAWLPQRAVKVFCEKQGLTYIHVLYEGQFVSWDHCRTFCHSPAYGEVQEGIVVKNQTRLNDPNTRQPFYLKIVNDDFKETMKRRQKIVDPETEAAKTEAFALAQTIVTRNRVEKMLFKLRDEGELPDKLQPSDMGMVARILPRRIYEDCVKEEREIVEECGAYFGKDCGSIAMKFAREVIVG